MRDRAVPYGIKQIQPTPNPNALKFVLDRVIAPAPASFFNAEAAEGHPIASRLFAISGVTSVLLLGDFVTINKTPAAKWRPITEKVRRVLSEISDNSKEKIREIPPDRQTGPRNRS